MAIIEKGYVIPNLTAGYVYNLTAGQTYSNPLENIIPEPENNKGHMLCGPIDLDVGTFKVSATLMADQYRWRNGGYELIRNDIALIGNLLLFNHSSSYEYIGGVMGRNPSHRFDEMSYDALRTNCVAFSWNNAFSDVPDTNVGSPINVLQPSGKSCQGYRELWHLDLNSELQIDGLPEKVDELGAFANAENLVEISIPPSVKKIGRYSFMNTSLTSVRIANDCVYYPTSFPQGCIIHFY